MLSIKQDIYSKTIEYGLIALILICPLIFMNSLHPELPKVVFAEIIIWTLFVVWVCRCIEIRDFSSRYTYLNKPILAFLCVVAISFIFSRYPKISSIDTMKFFSYGILFFLVVNFIDSEKKLSRILKSLVLVTLITCIYGFLQRYGLGWVITWMTARTSSTFLNPNFFAAFLVMMLPVSVYLYFRKQKLLHSFIYLVLTALILNNLLCTSTRSAWIGCFASFIFLGLAERRYFLKKKAKLFFIFLLVFIFLFLIFKSSRDLCPVYTKKIEVKGLQERVEQSFEPTPLEVVVTEQILEEEKVSLEEKKSLLNTIFDASRRLHHDTAARIFNDNVIAGSGVGTYGFMLPDYIDSTKLLDIYYKPKTVHTHNEYLQIMAEMGFLGIAAFLWLIFALFYSSYRLASANRKNQEKRNLIIALTAGIIAILIQNIFSVSLRYPAITLFFWIFTGLVFVSQDPDEKLKRTSLRPFLILAIILFFAFFCWIGAKVLLSDTYVTFSPSYNGLQKAIDLNPYSTDPYIMLAVWAKKNNNPAMAIYALKGLNRTVPDYFVVNYHLGLAYYWLGDYDMAMDELSKVKNKDIVREWIISSYYRNKYNMSPWQPLNMTVNEVDEYIKEYV